MDQTDDTVVSMTVAYGAVLSLLVQGHKLDLELSNKLMSLVRCWPARKNNLSVGCGITDLRMIRDNVQQIISADNSSMEPGT